MSYRSIVWSCVVVLAGAFEVATCSRALASGPQNGPLLAKDQAAGRFVPGQSAVFPAVNLGFAQQAETETTTVVTREETKGYTLSGPYFLRSADPEEPGEMELKFIYGYETSAEDSEHEVEFVLEWGMARNVEFIFEIPFVIGDGGIDGNGDISALGLHTRFWEEDGLIPAFAMRNLIRVPTGYHSNGVDYIGRGLFTWTLVPNDVRLHFNPFLKSVNGDNNEEARNFQWGAAIGADFRVNDELLFIADYLHTVGEDEGTRNNHAIELGMDWEFAEDQTLGVGLEFGVDGDSHGADFGIRLAYILELGAPRLDTP